MKIQRATSFILLLLFVSIITGFKTSSLEEESLPNGFVYVADEIQDVILEIRYYSTYNFVGTRIDGYFAPVAILTKEAVAALKEANEAFIAQGYIIKIFDAYRPQTAVNHFLRWIRDKSDVQMRSVFYPNIEKAYLVNQGYLSSKSSHTRGSTVDITLVDFKTGKELDMGSPFDFFSLISNHETSFITPKQKKNREILRQVMEASGFKSYVKEWWHYTLVKEPFPDTYFDFPVR